MLLEENEIVSLLDLGARPSIGSLSGESEVSRDGQTIVTIVERLSAERVTAAELVRIDATTGASVVLAAAYQMYGVNMSADGSTLLHVEGDRGGATRVVLTNLATGRSRLLDDAWGGGVLSPNGETMIVGARTDGVNELWMVDLVGDTPTVKWPIERGFSQVAVDDALTMAIHTGSGLGGGAPIYTTNLVTGETLRLHTFERSPCSHGCIHYSGAVAISPDGARVAYRVDGAIEVREMATGLVDRVDAFHSGGSPIDGRTARYLEFSPDGSKLIFNATSDLGVGSHLWNFATGVRAEPVGTDYLPIDADYAYFGPDGQMIVARDDALVLSSPFDRSLLRCSGSIVTVATFLGEWPTDGDDVIMTGSPAGWVGARAGDDIICGSTGADRIDAGPGDDIVYGLGGDDRINGRGGDDRITTGSGDASVHGGPGNDTLTSLIDTVTNSSNYDRGRFGWFHGGGGDDVIEAFGAIRGGSGDDIITVTEQRVPRCQAVVRAGRGADTITFADRLAIVYGGSGNDTIRGDGTGRFGDRNLGAEVYGGAGRDVIETRYGNDELLGGRGADVISGGEGDDQIDGGRGNDTCEVEANDLPATSCETTR